MKNCYERSFFSSSAGKMAFLLLSFMLFNGYKGKAQTTLASGDLAFTAFYSSPASPSPDEFSFILLAPIANGTAINFTDIGYNGITSTMPTTATLDATITWICSGSIPALTEVHITGLTATINGVSNGTVTCVENNGFGLPLSAGGDCILAYQGAAPATNPTLIAGIQMNYETGPPASTASTWDQLGVAPASYAYSNTRSSLPPSLNSTNSMWLGTEFDNGKFLCSSLPQASIAALRTAILNPANWTFNDVAQTTGWGVAGCSSWVGSPITLTMSNTNVSCNGGANGTATVSVSGGTAPYTYSWSPSGGTNATATGRPAGSYTVTVTDASSSTATGTVTITQPSAFSISTAQANVSCFGGSNGAAAVSVAGGTAPYTYSWSPSGGTNATASGRPAGNYTVTITDANSCTATRSFTLTQPSAPVSGTTVVTNVSCFGGSNGAIDLTPAGGTPGYTYNWGSSITTQDRTGLTAGNYTVSITDNNGCPATVTVSVTQPTSPVSGTTVVTNVACFGGSNGAINLTPSGGTGPYTFNWLPSGPTTEDRTGLVAGTYTVVITDANACTGTVTVSVTQPTAPVSGTTVVTNVACFGGSNGAINLTPSGGTGPYTFNWLPSGPTTEDRTGLVAGTYTVVVTDVNGCTGTVTVSVTQPTSPVSGTTVVTNVACFGGSNGAINLTPSGGTGPYTFNWLPSGPTTEDRTGLVAGTYTVVVTDVNGCTGTVTTSVTQPTSPVSGTTVVTNVACFGGSNGSINLTPSGGTGAGTYTFNWLPSGPTTEDRTGLVAGTYSVVITDANACTGTVTVSVTQPTSPVSGTTVVTNVACFGGSTGAINLTPSGGTGPYTFNWLPSGPTTEDRTGLVAGTYSVVITDANACTGTVTVSVTQPTSPVSGTTVVTNVACFGGSNGAINLTPSGGTGPYTFNWLPSGPTTEDRTGLVAGTYTVVVTDVNGCTGTVTTSVTQPTSPVSGTTVVTNVACFGGSNGAINLTPSGGTGPYTFNWLPSGPTTEDRTGLVAGTYTVVITDANACTGTVTVSVTQPTSPVSGTTVVTNVACFGGSNGAINLTPSGGTAPYTFNWLPSGPTTEDRTGLVAGTYTVVVTDVNGCTGTVTTSVTQPTSPVSGTTVVTNVACFGGSNGSINLTPSGGTGAGTYTFNWLPSGPTTEDRTGLVAGTYSVVITDANACTGTVTVSVTQPTSPVSGTTVVTNVACFGGSTGAINLTPSGGTGPYTFNWLPSGPTTEDRTGLVAGTYSVVITDANACTGTVTVSVTQPTSPVSGTTVVTNVACFGGSNGAINLTPSGGTGPYTFNWLPSGPTTEDRTGLVAGTYTVVVTDVNGCTGTVTTSVTQPTSPVSGTTVVTNVACFGGSNGAINLTPSGGTGPYTFNWLPSGPTTEDRTGLVAGTYTVVITDANACTGTVTVSVTQPTSPVSGTTVVTNVACFGGSNGAINLTPSGGTAPYTFNWLPSGPTTEDRTGLVAGTYSVVITDANACTGTVTATVGQPAAIVTTAPAPTNVSCNGGSNGSASVTVTGGTGAYTYNWTPGNPAGDGTASVTGLTAGTWSVTVTDANGCTATRTYSITQPSAIATTTSSTPSACSGNSGSATVTATGGTGTYSYSWSTAPVQTGATATGLGAGTYTVTVTDANGCTRTTTVTVVNTTGPSASISASSNVSCNGGSNGSATVTATGGTGSYTYNWSPSGGTAATATGLSMGSYTVTVTDGNSCQATASVSITQPSAITIVTTQSNVSCNGGNNGMAMASATGGTGAFTYSWNTTPAQTGAMATGLTMGTYIVTVADANNCPASATVTITEPTAIVTSTTQTDVTCNGGNNGTATVTATGGTGAFTYSWNTTPAQTGAMASGLTMGTYIVTVADANNCPASATVTITEPTAIVTSTTQTDVTCNGGNNGSATVTATGGTGAFTYSWNTTPAQTGAMATGLTMGTYIVTVADANNCPASATVTITEPTAIVTSTTQTDVTCNGGNNGTATVTATGGTGAFTYSWNTTPAQTGAMATGLTMGTYIVTIADANNCPASATVTITEPTAIVTSTTQTDVTCNGGNNGSVTVTATGGTGTFTYSWNTTPAQTGAMATGLTMGTYIVTIADANNCPASATVTINEPAVLTASTSVTNVTCNGGADATATAIVTGGTGSYSYAWDDAAAQTTATATGLTAGTYSVMITDANLCTTSATVTTTQPFPLTTTLTATNETCSPGSDAIATVYPSGGSGNYTYLWDDAMAQTTAAATGLTAGTYSVIVTDAMCGTTSGTITVNGSPAPVVTISNDTTVCEGSTVTLIATGGTTYAWDNGAGSNDTAMVTPTATTAYNVMVTDNNGCSATAMVTVTVDPQVSAGFTYMNMGSSVMFNNTSNGASTWDFGDGSPLDNTTNPTHTYVLDGTYVVTLVAANSCGTDTVTDTIVVFTTGMIDASAMNISIAPNPSEGMFTVSVSNGAAQVMADVVDMQGRVVYSAMINASSQLDLTTLAKGVYYIKVSTGEKTATKRIIIQ